MTTFRRHKYRSEVRKTMVLAGPVVVSQLGQMSMGFVDTLMVGRLGAESLAGVALGNTLFFFLLIVSSGVVIAVAPVVSQAYGANDDETIERSVRQGLVIGILLTLPCALLLWNIEPLLLAMGQDPGVVALSAGYLHAIVWGFLPFLWFTALRSFLEGFSRPLPVTVITLCGLAINIVANYVFMFGKWGFPELGVVGTGLASTIVYWSMFIILLCYTRAVSPFKNYRLVWGIGTPDARYLKALLSIGWPIGVSHGVESGLFSATALFVGLIGTASLAAHQIALQCAAYTFMVPMGIGMAASVRVGQAVGRRDLEQAQTAGFVAMGLALLFMIGAAVLFVTAPRSIIGLYIDTTRPGNAEVVQIATVLLGVAAVFQVFDGIQVSAAGSLRGLKDTRIPMIISVLAYWGIGLSSGLVLGFGMDFGAVGLWWGLVLGLAAAAVMLTLRFWKTTSRFLQP